MHLHNYNTDKCFTLQNKKNAGNSKKKEFSNKTLRNEINMLLHKKLHAEVLEQYLTVISKEKAKLSKKDKKAKYQMDNSDSSDSDSDTTIAVIEQEVSPSKQKGKWKST